MKPYKLLLVLLAGFFAIYIKAPACLAADVNIIFVNGIDNTAAEYFKSMKKIEKILNASANHSGTKKKTFKVLGVWNPIGFTGHDAVREGVHDFRELFLLKTAEEFYGDDFQKIMVPFDQPNSVDKAAAGAISSKYLDSMLLGKSTNYQEAEGKISADDLEATQAAVLDIVKKIKTYGAAVVIAHSEGNLLANLAYAKLVSQFGDDTAKKIRVVNVANTSAFSVNNLNFTHAGDQALFPGLLTLPTTGNELAWPTDLSPWWRKTPKCDGTCNFAIASPPFGAPSANGTVRHNFQDTYLSTDTVPLNDSQGVTFTFNKERFVDRFEDFVYAAADSLAQSGPPSFSVSGKVRSGSNAGPGLLGATVDFGNYKTAVTDSTGAYFLGDLALGYYLISVSKPGYGTYTGSYSNYAADSSQTILDFALTRTPGTYSLSGTIHVGSDIGPTLSGATVSFAGSTATSGSLGEFEISGITPGTYPFSVSKPGYATYANPGYYLGSDQLGQNFYLTVGGGNAGSSALPDTGQTGDYTPTFGEDSDYTINPPSYTVHGDGTVTDNVTGLMWQRQDDGVTRTWSDAVAYCNNLNLAGYADWRLPSKKELVGIVDYGRYYPAIDTSAFPNTIASGYWSSTTYALNTGLAWGVGFGYGGVGNGVKVSNLYARCVRGGQ